MSKTKQKTTGEIAIELGVHRDRVIYAIKAMSIPHAGKVGIRRLFDGRQVNKIREYLVKIDTRRQAAAIPLDGVMHPQVIC